MCDKIFNIRNNQGHSNSTEKQDEFQMKWSLIVMSAGLEILSDISIGII